MAIKHKIVINVSDPNGRKIKKEKPLPYIAADEIPFEIPKNWKWVRLKCITRKITDKRVKLC